MERCATPLRVAAFLAMLAVPGFASAAVCVPDSLSGYLGLSDCSIGGLTFSGFTTAFETPFGATLIDPAAVTVTPIAGAGKAGLSLTLADGVEASSAQVFELLFGFRVTPVGAVSIANNRLELLGTASLTGDGVVTGIQNLCIGGDLFPNLVCTGSPVDAVVLDDGITRIDAEDSALNTTVPIAVALDLGVDAGTFGTASLGRAGGLSAVFTTQAAATVDEPCALGCLLALFGIAAGMRGNGGRRA